MTLFKNQGVPIVVQWKQIWLVSMRCGFDPWPCSVGRGTSIAVSCGVCRRYSSDPTLLWLWCRPEAVALIRPLAWEHPYATGTALQSKKKKKKKKKKSVIAGNSFSFVAQWVRDLALSPQWLLRLLLWRGFDPWPGNFHMGTAKKKKKSIHSTSFRVEL